MNKRSSIMCIFSLLGAASLVIALAIICTMVYSLSVQNHLQKRFINRTMAVDTILEDLYEMERVFGNFSRNWSAEGYQGYEEVCWRLAGDLENYRLLCQDAPVTLNYIRRLDNFNIYQQEQIKKAMDSQESLYTTVLYVGGGLNMHQQQTLEMAKKDMLYAENRYEADFKAISGWIFLISGAFGLAAFSMGGFLIRFSVVTRRALNGMTDYFNRLGDRDWEAPDLKESKYREFRLISQTANRMKQEIKNYIKEIEKQAKLEKQLNEERLINEQQHTMMISAQMSALRAQVNPHFLFNSLNLIGVTALTCANGGNMSNRKNVLMICTDHWSGSLLGCEGRKDIMTPTIDYLADNGIRFQNFYSECPVCIPARRTMMTGLSPRTHGDRVYSDRMEMPAAPTLAQTFCQNGYQTLAVGKLHVYPQRSRIGFEDVILAEEGRYELGAVDDYQVWLGEHGYLGQEFMHGMGNNTYYTRPWHLDEQAHPTNWVTMEMMHQIKRKDPTRPFFFYCSYQFPHPPLVPLQSFLDMYDEEELEPVSGDDWMDDSLIFHSMREQASGYSEREKRRARRAFFAQCTHIDYQIRLLIGTLRESNLLNDTILVFTSDHGDMLFNHGMVAKRCFYEEAARVPFILSGTPLLAWRGKVESKLAGMGDLMPTLLDLCDIPIPETVEGIPLMTDQTHPYLYGEVSEGEKATRMIRWEQYKLIYYPWGNKFQLFDLEKDRKETHDCAKDPKYRQAMETMTQYLIGNLHGSDLNWIRDGHLVGSSYAEYQSKADFGLYNQRGYHWPPPTGYSNQGKNA